ncbi:Electron transport complex protein RnfB [hydrothermal vent metagenome]|uniref:Electron transport complex protein RnfB n=1 Tax=hydrothermal vent metagenome TaxID=652676 RepID=A0A3B1B8N7_9ZZZZ
MPQGTHAFIDEQTCIGCTLCIQVCPVDAILGAAKRMHTVITQECTGCRDCIAPCPVDCIEMLPFKNQAWTPAQEQQRVDRAEHRRKSRDARLERLKLERKTRLQQKQATLKKGSTVGDAKKAAIEAAIKRAAAKKSAMQTRPRNTDNLTPAQQAQVDAANTRRTKL